jgi:hypothetical protein
MSKPLWEISIRTSARCECTFYRLEENNKPNLELVENICANLFRKKEAAFVEQKDSSAGRDLSENKDAIFKMTKVTNWRKE